jgi:hypothetical protein
MFWLKTFVITTEIDKGETTTQNLPLTNPKIVALIFQLVRYLCNVIVSICHKCRLYLNKTQNYMCFVG